MKRLVSLGLCISLLSILVGGLISPATNIAYAVDMGGDAPATQDTITAAPSGNEGKEDKRTDSENGDELPPGDDARVTIDSTTDKKGNDNNDDENDDIGKQNTASQVQGDENAAALASQQCLPGQEPGLFVTCMPIQACSNQPGLGMLPILNPQNTKDCANAQFTDPPSSDE